MNVEQLLIDNSILHKESEKDFIVKCLNPNHEDRTPSMRIDKVIGVFHCFSCGYKGNLFSLFGVEQNILDIRRQKILRGIEKVRMDTIGLEMPQGYTAVDYSYRDISVETLMKFGAFKHPNFIDRIVFPITDITGRIVCFIGRAVDQRVDGPKYKIEPKGSSVPLFPTPVVPINSSIILVEGIFDMLNLHDNGLTNTVCCFGTSNVNKDKLEVLKMLGANRIDVAFDGDSAGQEGALRVEKLCQDNEMFCRIIPLKQGTDPGSMNSTRINKLRKYLYG